MKIYKQARTSQKVNSLIANRWSTRSFDPNRKVSREDIISICEAGRWAPSCYGDEPWRIMIFDKFHNLEAYHKAFDCLGEWNQKWVNGTPVLAIVFASEKFRHNGKANRWAQFDTGACTMNMHLQALDLGLMSHPMGGFDAEKVIKTFAIPNDMTPMAFIAFGYQNDVEAMPDDYQLEEKNARKRQELSSNFFDSEWQKGIL